MSAGLAVAPNPNRLSPRAAMGLPEALVERWGADLLAQHADLRTASVQMLTTTLESADATLGRRYAAGTMLAYVGDPRIDPFAPRMIRHTGGRVVLGLAPDRAEAVAAAWRHVGVRSEWIRKECPQYVIDVAPFALARYPVTHLEFRTYLAHTASRSLPTAWTLGTYPLHLANHPVWTVSPEAADAYAAWLSNRTGRRFRLPSESEWEYAATLGDGRDYPWGNGFDPRHANTVEGGPLGTSPVGMYPSGRTLAGVDDMAGNVEEYTADSYRPYPGGEQVCDDLHAGNAAYRVARGGSFARHGDLARCQRRHGWFDAPIYAMGFRLAESI